LAAKKKGFMKTQEKQSGLKHKVIGVSVIVVTLAALLAAPTIAYLSNRVDSNTQNSNVAAQTEQAKCLNDAYTSYESGWKAADKDGDGKVAYNDGATDVTTAYYDAAISCYRTHKTNDSESSISDFQAKRQQETDKYTAWLESSKQPTYVPSYSNNYRSSMSCRSSSIGASVYTTCN
jgi:hypothetical protein